MSGPMIHRLYSKFWSTEETVSHPNNLQISEVSLQIFGNFFTGNLTGESTLDVFKSDASQ